MSERFRYRLTFGERFSSDTSSAKGSPQTSRIQKRIGMSKRRSGQVDKLNKLGDEGWEVVTLNATTAAEAVPSYNT